MSRTYVGARVDDVDLQVEKVARLINNSARIDRELAAGLGCTESMASIQTKVDTALANCETLAAEIRRMRAKQK